jgi:hypothetical protein
MYKYDLRLWFISLLQVGIKFFFLLQMRLSPEDLKMMVDEASDKSSKGTSTVDLKTFINIMKNSAW